MDFYNTKQNIETDVKEVFEEIQQEIYSNYFTPSNLELSYIRDSLRQHLPTTIVNKNLLLMDTVLNYLTEEARKALENQESKVINTFYDKNQQWAEQLKNALKNALQNKTGVVTLSPDLRVKQGIIGGSVGAGIGFAGGTLLGKTVLELESLFAFLSSTTLLAAFVGIFAYKIAYQQATPNATEQVKEDSKKFLKQAEKNTSSALENVIENYDKNFKQFLVDNEI